MKSDRMVEKMSNTVDDNEIVNNTQTFGYKTVKRKHVAAILRKSQKKKVSDESDVEVKKEATMEDFQHHSALGDDLFDALNSSDIDLTGDKKNQIIQDIYDGSELKPDSVSQTYPGFTSAEPIPSNSSYKQSEIMFPRMPILSDELSYESKKSGNPMDEFLSFNNPRISRVDKTEDSINESSDFKMNDDSYLNMVSMLNDNYPKIDLNGIAVDKPIDVVVGLPDNFIVKNYNLTDKIDNEKNDILNENRFINNDFILNDSDFLSGTNLMTTKQLNEANSNLIADQVLNLDFSNNPMYLNKNYPNLRAGGNKTESVNDYNYGNCTTFSLSYGDNSYLFMEEKNFGNFGSGCKSVAEKGNSQELNFEENNCLTDIDLNLSNNIASEIEDKFTPPSSKIGKKLALDSKRNLENLNDEEEEELIKPFDYKYQSKRAADCNKENNLHYVRYQHLGDRSIKIWQCGVCGKDFRHQYTLTRHLPTHTDERNYKCETCGKAFRQMSTLSQHRAIHSDARPYVCEFCRKTFNRVSTLISHKKTHSDYKPHKCHICGKAFHQKGNLRNHIFTHTNERPYKCDICSKGFNQMSNLMCHKAHTHSEKGMYPCIRCGQVFNKRFSLRTHEEYVHGIKYPSREVSSEEKKNVRVVQLQNENKNGEQPFSKTVKQIPSNRSPLQRLKITKTYITEKGIVTEKSMCVGIVIDLIKTKAMESAKQNGQTPFALFKPSSGIPVLVKVLNANGDTQHMLVPATPDDLKVAGKITVAPNSETASVKTVQIKVPVVATVIQSFDEWGKMHIEVEPPGPELENQNNELQKKNKKIVKRQESEPEIFCEAMESESESGQELILPPADSNNVQLLSIDAAKKIFNKKKLEDIGKKRNNMENSNKYTGFGAVMSFMSGEESAPDDQNHVSSSTNTVDGEEIYLIRDDTNSCETNESNEFRELPILS